MSESDLITEDQLNAFIDNELDVAARAEMLAAIEKDEQLANRVSRMRQDMDLLALAFEEPPLPDNFIAPGKPPHWRTGWAVAASISLLLLGGMVGWWTHQQGAMNIGDHFLEARTLDINSLRDQPVLLHISQMDTAKIDAALNRAEEILKARQNDAQPLQLEIVANADGLGLLRKGSPYAERIQSLSERYDNVSFKACGIAMENARLKEGSEVILLPQAEKIPAALGRILKRVKQGWTYLKG